MGKAVVGSAEPSPEQGGALAKATMPVSFPAAIIPVDGNAAEDSFEGGKLLRRAPARTVA